MVLHFGLTELILQKTKHVFFFRKYFDMHVNLVAFIRFFKRRKLDLVVYMHATIPQFYIKTIYENYVL